MKIHTYKGNQGCEEAETEKPVIPTNITFSHNFLQNFQISCLKNQHAKNQIVCLTASFTIVAFWRSERPHNSLENEVKHTDIVSLIAFLEIRILCKAKQESFDVITG